MDADRRRIRQYRTVRDALLIESSSEQSGRRDGRAGRAKQWLAALLAFMPPKTSTALVNRGVSGLANKQKAGGVARTNRHGHGEARAKRTTSLVLRDGPGGVWGTGEVMLKGGHFSGPQKLAARASA